MHQPQASEPERDPERRASASRPRNLVILPEASVDAERWLADVAFGSPATDRPGTRHAAAAANGGSEAFETFHSLGVVALDLDDEEVERVQEGGGTVVPNQRRCLPRVCAASTTASASRTHPQPPTNWCLDMIGVPTHKRQFTGKDVRVAVLDTGIAPTHPDLQRVSKTRSWVRGESAHDLHGHGTHCAGVVAGSSPCRGRIPYGVAPEVDLMIGKVLDRRGVGYDNDILSAIEWAVLNGAELISLSIETPLLPGEPCSALYEAVAQQLRDRVLIVAAAGNAPSSGKPGPVSDPACCPSILAVGAVDRNGNVAVFSNRGLTSTDLCAPGVDVYSSWLRHSHRESSGTSMAAPHVTGIAALMAQRHPGIRGAALRQQLLASARRSGAIRDYGNGLPQL